MPRLSFRGCEYSWLFRSNDNCKSTLNEHDCKDWQKPDIEELKHTEKEEMEAMLERAVVDIEIL
jgi:hypothetical protein